MIAMERTSLMARMMRMIPRAARISVAALALTACTPQTTGTQNCPPPPSAPVCPPIPAPTVCPSAPAPVPCPPRPVITLSEDPAGIVTGANGREARVTKGQTNVELTLRISGEQSGATAEVALAEGVTGENGIDGIVLEPATVSGSTAPMLRLRFNVAANAVVGARVITLKVDGQPVTVINNAFQVAQSGGGVRHPQGPDICVTNPGACL